MGNYHSEPRGYRISPDATQSDIPLEYITITGAVLKRLEAHEGERKGYPVRTIKEPPRQRPQPVFRESFRRRLWEQEDALNESIRRNEETFRRSSQNLEDKLKKAERNGQNQLKGVTDVLLDCLRTNSGESLRCNKEMLAFNNQIFQMAAEEGQRKESGKT